MVKKLKKISKNSWHFGNKCHIIKHNKRRDGKSNIMEHGSELGVVEAWWWNVIVKNIPERPTEMQKVGLDGPNPLTNWTVSKMKIFRTEVSGRF